jgi:hypothetical protein
LEREPGLARAPGAGHGDEPAAVREERDELGDLVLAIEERRRDDGKVAGVERLQRRKLGEAELVEMLRLGQVLESVLAEGGDFVSLDQVARRLREKHLAAVAGGADSRRAVHVDADVAFVRHDRLAGVDPHAYEDRAGRQLRLSLERGGDRIGRTRKGGE